MIIVQNKNKNVMQFYQRQMISTALSLQIIAETVVMEMHCGKVGFIIAHSDFLSIKRVNIIDNELQKKYSHFFK